MSENHVSKHLTYWCATEFGHLFVYARPKADTVPKFYSHLTCLLKETIGIVNSYNLNPRDVTSKYLYTMYNNTPPPAKILFKDGMEHFDFSNIFKRLWHKGHNPIMADLMFSLIHDILPTPERLFRFNLVSTPNCRACNVIADKKHIFI